MKSDAVRLLRDALADALLPPPALLVSEWAQQNFQLSSEYSAATGHFEPYPYQTEPLDVLSPSNPADTIALMCAAQMMKTLIIMIFLGYVIDVDPGPALIVQPNKEDADSFSKERLAPMVNDVPCVAAKTVESKSRDSGNTILQKRFRGGSVSLTGAVSPRGLRRRSVRYLFLDEVDGYEETSDGDPISLAAARTSKFWNRKIILCSTPTIKGRSRIEKAFLDSDQRRYFVPCPECGELQTLEWRPAPDAGVRWGQIGEQYVAPEDAVYQCIGCKTLIPHYRKLEMLRAGEWRATNPAGKYPGFGISRLYAPDWSWGRIVTDPMEGFLAAKDDAARMQTFKNNVLAEVYQQDSESLDWEKLMSRCIDSPYRMGQVPQGAAFLTAGVDVQKSWLEGYVWGWGRNRQRWLIDHWRIEGDPFGQVVWDDLGAKVASVYRRMDGAELNISKFAVDTGHATNEVYQFARQHGAGRVLAVDGRARGAALVGFPTMVDVTIRGRKIANGCKLWPVNVSMAKSELYGLLSRERPKADEPLPPGWVHFPADAPEEFFRQLTAERLVPRVVKGFRRYEWQKDSSQRNEALDCYDYARAGAFIEGFDRAADEDWDYLEGRVAGGMAVSRPAPQAPPQQAQRTSPPPARRVQRSDFMRSFLG